MIGISMRVTRVTYPGGASELRDSLDENWHNFLKKALPEKIVLPLPNNPDCLKDFLARLPFGGFILSGGEDWGAYPQRDLAESLLFDHARSHKLPILGICRGAQLVCRLLGGELAPIAGHVATRHNVDIVNRPPGWPGPESLAVNSFHNSRISRLGAGLKPWALCGDGAPEAFADANWHMAGIMWHPEREREPLEHDRWIFQKCLNRR